MVLEETMLAQFIDSQLAKTFGQYYKKFGEYIPILVKRNNEFVQKIAALENQIKSISSRLEKIEKANAAKDAASPVARSAVTQNAVTQNAAVNNYVDEALVQKFNAWAEYSAAALSGDFMFLAGDIKVRAALNLTESAAPSEWITNRTGAKKYLFPNPQFLDDRSNITAFYENGIGFTKPKGQNKIRIIKPCEIENSNFISYPGKLQIL